MQMISFDGDYLFDTGEFERLMRHVALASGTARQPRVISQLRIFAPSVTRVAKALQMLFRFYSMHSPDVP